MNFLTKKYIHLGMMSVKMLIPNAFLPSYLDILILPGMISRNEETDR